MLRVRRLSLGFYVIPSYRKSDESGHDWEFRAPVTNSPCIYLRSPDPSLAVSIAVLEYTQLRGLTMKRIEILGTAARVGLTVCLVVTALAQSAGQPLTTAVTVLADGRTQLTIHNSSGVWMTAYATETTDSEHKRSATWFQDSMLAGGVTTTAPGSDFNIIVAQPNEHPLVTFHAALFQDGSTFGDSDWVQRLQNRRLYAAQAFALALADLSALAPSATSPADLAQRLKDQGQARVSALPAASTTAQAIDKNDRVLMLTTRYPVVESAVTGGMCSYTSSMADCASKVNAWMQQRYVQLLQVATK
jgi:hypothetical protein